MSTTTVGTAVFDARAVDARAVDARAVTANAPRLRLTRRGRVVIGGLLAAPIALLLAFGALGGSPAQAGQTVSDASFDYITVAAGESLWDLAAWIDTEADPREVVADLVQLNRLSSTEVQPGQRLAIPAEYSD